MVFSSMEQEYVDVVDEQDNPTGRHVTIEEAHAGPGLLHRHVKVFVVNRQSALYLKKRSKDQDFAEYWEPAVNGNVRAGETYEQAGERELYEETGITARILNHVARFRNETEKESNWNMAFWCRYDGPIRLNEEASEGRFFFPENLREALERRIFKFTPGTRKALEAYFKHEAGFYDGRYR